MGTTTTARRADTTTTTPPTRFVTVVAVLVALWCAVFAGISVWFEVTDRFATGPHAADAAALSVVNWYVAFLKLGGVVVALAALRRPGNRPTARIVGSVLWAGFATLGIYSLGSLAQAAVFLGGSGSADRLGVESIGYVLAFLLGAAGFGVLATSYARRNGLGRGEVVVGVMGAPLALGSILIVLPALLRSLGLLRTA